MYVPVVTSAHDDDIAGPIETLPATPQHLSAFDASHAGTSNGEIHGFTEPEPQVCQARRSPSHQRGNHNRGVQAIPLEAARQTPPQALGTFTQL